AAPGRGVWVVVAARGSLLPPARPPAGPHDGALTGTMVVYPGEGTVGLSVYARGGAATLRSIEVTQLASIW
ncbi:hypothetical protein ACFWH7_12880, partial [Cellulosimicrobium cellulans]|uniref:hypothetical protein n=1 Tax=Cellulosimicrobium cellulans TaxID=1710 RepID=UPI0036514937